MLVLDNYYKKTFQSELKKNNNNGVLVKKDISSISNLYKLDLVMLLQLALDLSQQKSLKQKHPTAFQ